MRDCRQLPRSWRYVDHAVSRRLVLPDVRSELAHHLSVRQLLFYNWVECPYTMSGRQLLFYHRVDSTDSLHSWHVRCDYGQQRVYGMCFERHRLRRSVCRVLQRRLQKL